MSLLLWSSVTLYFYMALLSFSPLDPSPFSVRSPAAPPINQAGEWGAWLSSWLLYHVGLGAYVLPLPCWLYCLSRQASNKLVYPVFKAIISFLFVLAFVVLSLRQFQPQVLIQGYPMRAAGVVGDSLYAAIGHWGGEAGLGLSLVALLALGLSLLVAPTFSAGRLVVLWLRGHRRVAEK